MSREARGLAAGQAHRKYSTRLTVFTASCGIFSPNTRSRGGCRSLHLLSLQAHGAPAPDSRGFLGLVGLVDPVSPGPGTQSSFTWALGRGGVWGGIVNTSLTTLVQPATPVPTRAHPQHPGAGALLAGRGWRRCLGWWVRAEGWAVEGSLWVSHIQNLHICSRVEVPESGVSGGWGVGWEEAKPPKWGSFPFLLPLGVDLAAFCLIPPPSHRGRPPFQVSILQLTSPSTPL